MRLNKFDFIYLGLDVAHCMITLRNVKHKTTDNEDGPEFRILEADDKGDSIINVDFVVFFKDHFRISDKAYTAIRLYFAKNLPPLSYIIIRRNYFNSFFTLTVNNFGIYVDVNEKLDYILSAIYDQIPNIESFKIKVSADATLIGRSLKLLILTFSVISESQRCQTASGTYMLAVFNILEESYEVYYQCFSIIFNSLEQYKFVMCNKKQVNVDMVLGGDWAFLAKFHGLMAASSKYPCLYCTCKQTEFAKATDPKSKYSDLSVTDIKKLARSKEECLTCMNKKDVNEKKGYEHQSISHFFSQNRTIFDLFHMRLRISGTLLDRFVNIDILKVEKTQSHYMFTKSPVVAKFKNFIYEKCGISQAITEGEKGFFIKNFTGKQYAKIFRMIFKPESDFLNNFREIKNIVDITKLWYEFHKIVHEIKQEKLSCFEIRERNMQWLEMYNKLYFSQTVTPYMHVFVSHLPEITENHGNINFFNQQGVEKLNDLITCDFLKSNNRKESSKSSFLYQLMNKSNRRDIFGKMFPEEFPDCKKRKKDDMFTF